MIGLTLETNYANSFYWGSRKNARSYEMLRTDGALYASHEGDFSYVHDSHSKLLKIKKKFFRFDSNQDHQKSLRT